MKKIAFMAVALICIISMFSSCEPKKVYHTFETDLGDTLCLEFYMSESLHGTYPHYLIYDGDTNIEKKNGCVLYVDHKNEGCLPDDPVSNISTVGKYGDYNFYKIFDSLFYYQKGVYMDSLGWYTVDYYEYDKKAPQVSDSTLYRAQAISDLMKSQNFEFIYKYGEIPASDNDPYMHEMLVRYANGDFSEDEKQINASSNITESDMTSFAKYVLEKYYTE